MKALTLTCTACDNHLKLKVKRYKNEEEIRQQFYFSENASNVIKTRK